VAALDAKLCATQAFTALKWFGQESGLRPLQKQFLQKALDYYRAFTQEQASDPATRLATADAFLRVGEIHKALGDLAAAEDALVKAIADFTEAIRLNPNLSEAYSNRGYSWREKHEYEKAIAEFTEAIRLNPNLSEAYRHRGTAWLAKKHYDRALADFSEAIRINPQAEWLYYGRAVTRFILRDQGVTEDLKRVLELNDGKGGHSTYAVILGCLAARIGKDEAQAREFLGPLAARLDTSSWPCPAVRYLRGELDAAGLLAQANIHGKRHVHTYLGLELLAQGQTDRAVEHFRWVRDHPESGILVYWISLAELDRAGSQAVLATAAGPK